MSRIQNCLWSVGVTLFVIAFGLMEFELERTGLAPLLFLISAPILVGTLMISDSTKNRDKESVGQFVWRRAPYYLITLAAAFGLVSIILTRYENDYSGDFLLGMLFLIGLVVVIVTTKPQRRTVQEGRADHESSDYQRALERYNDECWNTNDFTEPPAIGDDKR